MRRSRWLLYGTASLCASINDVSLPNRNSFNHFQRATSRSSICSDLDETSTQDAEFSSTSHIIGFKLLKMSKADFANGSSGSGSAAPPPSFEDAMNASQPTFKSKFACLTLNLSDTIRLIRFPEPAVDAVKEAVSTSWPKGVKRIRPYGQSTEIKVHGWPWGLDTNGNDDARRMILNIFERLFDMGWVHQSGIDVTGKATSKGNWRRRGSF